MTFPSSQTAYAKQDHRPLSLRQVEYDLFAQVTKAMISSQAPQGQLRTQLLAAVLRNEQLWSTLAEDVARSDNLLPANLRSRILYLYRFTLQHSQKIRFGEAQVNILIDINTLIMRGLRGSGAPI